MPVKSKNKNKWFEAGKSLGWSKEDKQSTRRRNALHSRNGNYLRTARALLALANVTQDDETARKAHADAMYFFRKHKQEK